MAPPSTFDPNAERIAELSQAETAQFSNDFGRPTDGCLSIGHKETFGNLLVVDPRMSQFMAESYDRVRADERVFGAKERWSECMRAHGFEFDEREDILNEIGEQFSRLPTAENGLPTPDTAGLAEIQAREHQLYKLDVSCFLESGYMAAIRNVRREVENEIIEKNDLRP